MTSRLKTLIGKNLRLMLLVYQDRDTQIIYVSMTRVQNTRWLVCLTSNMTLLSFDKSIFIDFLSMHSNIFYGIQMSNVLMFLV